MNKLRELREEKKLTQKELAEQIKINKMTYNNYENGKREPNIATLINLADFYEVSIDYLVGRNFCNEFGYLNNNEKELITMFRQMSNDNQLMFFSEARGVLIAQR